MKLTTTWNQKFTFSSTDGTSTALMDTVPPYGDGKALSPKQLCLAAITGCTGMDVVSHLGKHKHPPHALRIEADAPVTKGYPAVFSHVELDFYFEGEVQTALAVEAVQLSQTKYCGVSAMIAKSCPIRYRVHVNGSLAAQGEAKFP
jgi:putative redox protein